MSDFRRTSHGADAGDTPVDEMPLTPLDRERRRDEFRVERYHVPENPDIVAFRVVDQSGKLRGFVGLEWDATDVDLPARILTRAQRAASAHPRPDLKLVG